MQLGEVGGGGVQVGPEGGQLAALGIEQGLGRQGQGGGGEGVQKAQGELLELLHEMGEGEGEGGVLAQLHPALHQGFQVLVQLPQPVFPPFRHPGGLGQADHSVRGQVVDGGVVSGVALGQLVVGHLLPGAILLPLGQHLPHREEHRLVQMAHPALGGGVKQAHGVHVGVPELHPHRVVLGGGEHVQNAATQGKLAHALHLVAPGVAQGRQGIRQLGGVIGAAGADGHHMFQKLLRGEGAL